jgi:phosphoribosylanthranilate isomerase
VRPPLVKVCGFTDPGEAARAASDGVDLVGVVLAESSRRVDTQRAREIADAVRSRARVVVVLADPDEEELNRVVREVRPDFVQLHGRESPGLVTGCPVPVIKAFVDDGGPSPADRFTREALRHPAAAWYLFDAGRGSGRTLPWEALSGAVLPRPWILAGGLTPGNVARAVRTLSPDGIDCSSGVENRPGRKDAAAIRRLVDTVKGIGGLR